MDNHLLILAFTFVFKSCQIGADVVTIIWEFGYKMEGNRV